jgi:hypothetical protein
MFFLDPTFFHPGSASKNLSILTPKKKTKKMVSKPGKYDPGCSSRIWMLTFYPSRIPDPGVKKAPDPGSGSATLSSRMKEPNITVSRQTFDLVKSDIQLNVLFSEGKPWRTGPAPPLTKLECPPSPGSRYSNAILKKLY